MLSLLEKSQLELTKFVLYVRKCVSWFTRGAVEA